MLPLVGGWRAWGVDCIKIVKKKPDDVRFSGAEDEARTRDLNLGKVALYQLSYFRIYKLFEKKSCLFLFASPAFRCVAFISGGAKIGKEGTDAKFFLNYLYWGVYKVFPGTLTSGLPL